jgi:hypothetical protein
MENSRGNIAVQTFNPIPNVAFLRRNVFKQSLAACLAQRRQFTSLVYSIAACGYMRWLVVVANTWHQSVQKNDCQGRLSGKLVLA